MNDFQTEYQKKFISKNYKYLKNNCADAVKFTLDYFFPETTAEHAYYCAYQMLCCLCCIGTLGLKCFSTVPACITTPNDVFKMAQQLSVRYGKPIVENKLTVAQSFGSSANTKQQI